MQPVGEPYSWSSTVWTSRLNKVQHTKHLLLFTSNVFFPRRFLGWQENESIEQKLQITEDGDTLPGLHQPENNTHPALMLPWGYSAQTQQDLNAHGALKNRMMWSEKRRTTWGGRHCSSLEWTATELVARAQNAEDNCNKELQTKRSGRHALQMDKEQRSRAYQSAKTAHKAWVKRTTGGVKGMPSFSALSYFR